MREYCNENNMDFLPNDIVFLFALWLSFCDRFDENLSNKDIKLETKNDDDYGEYQQIHSSLVFGISNCNLSKCY